MHHLHHMWVVVPGEPPGLQVQAGQVGRGQVMVLDDLSGEEGGEKSDVYERLSFHASKCIIY